jgi:gliding motility-associated protein GldC
VFGHLMHGFFAGDRFIRLRALLTSMPKHQYQMKKSEIKFTVTLDDERVPEKIDWSASDLQEEAATNAIMIALWDAQKSNTLRVNLWTKSMMKEEMKKFHHQSLLFMADNFERATGDVETSRAMRNFAQKLGEKMNLVMENKFMSMKDK